MQPLPVTPEISPGPRPVQAPPRESRRGWWWLLALVPLGAFGYWLWSKPDAAATQIATAVRTAVVKNGRLQNSIRLSGSTAAERFSSLVTPTLRFSRSDRSRSGGTLSAVSSMPPLANVTPSTGGFAAAAAATSSGGSVATAISSNGNTAGGGMRAGGGRASVGRINNSAARSSAAATGGARAASSGGEDGLGSTSSQLGQGLGGGGGGGGGGRGGSGDFMLVLQRLAPAGKMVRKGEVVAEFDRQFMLNRLDDYRNAVKSTQAAVNKLAAEMELYRFQHAEVLKTAQAQLDKAKLDMKTIPVLSAIDAEKAKLALEEAEARLKEVQAEAKQVVISQTAQQRYAELELRASELELKRAEENAERMVSRAAIDGLAVVQNTFRGTEFSNIQKGDQLYPGQYFMQVVDPSSMVVNATVNQVDVERVRVGNKATVSFDAFPGLTLPAEVVSIAAVPKNAGFRANFVREIPVRLRILKTDARVIPDLSVSVDVEMSAAPADTQLVPRGALTMTSENRALVFRRENGQWQQREVELLDLGSMDAAVRGLREGDVIALDKPQKEPS
jgi:HlyD family secretion protein